MISSVVKLRLFVFLAILLVLVTELLRPLVAVAQAAGGTAAQGPRVALVIGNGGYQHIRTLLNPPNDAHLMAHTLNQLGFTVIEGKPGEPVIDADRKTMSHAIAQFVDRLSSLGSTAIGLFFYAGHAVQSQADGKNYLIPIDADISYEAELEDEAVSANSVLRRMEIAAPGVKIMVLDACRDNPFRSLTRSTSRGLVEMSAPASPAKFYEIKPRGSLIGYSTAPGAVAADGTGQNSPYTQALADAMMVPGVEIRSVFDRVADRVAEATRGNQQPWISHSLLGELYLSKAMTKIIVELDQERIAPASQALRLLPGLSIRDRQVNIMGETLYTHGEFNDPTHLLTARDVSQSNPLYGIAGLNYQSPDVLVLNVVTAGVVLNTVRFSFLDKEGRNRRDCRPLLRIAPDRVLSSGFSGESRFWMILSAEVPSYYYVPADRRLGSPVIAFDEHKGEAEMIMADDRPCLLPNSQRTLMVEELKSHTVYRILDQAPQGTAH